MDESRDLPNRRGELNIVTGAFSYAGKYITRQLLASGRRVKTLTSHPNRPDPFDGRVGILPYSFERPDELARNLEGATTFYNTYWVRFPHGRTCYESAVENSKVLIRSAKEAGVRRFVHVSITNASPNSPFSYFRGKGMVEDALRDSGMSYAILRPTVVFGDEDILINNIAWLLREFPLFLVPGSGEYRLQPVFVDDVAELAVSAGERSENETIDAVGPESFTFRELVGQIRCAVASRTRIVCANPTLTFLLSKFIGLFVGDVVLTREEVEGLMANLLVSGQAPTCKTSFSEWLSKNASHLGLAYSNELDRHFRPSENANGISEASATKDLLTGERP